MCPWVALGRMKLCAGPACRKEDIRHRFPHAVAGRRRSDDRSYGRSYGRFFYAYSSSVTIGLGRMPDAQYVAAMQELNASVQDGLFAFGFFGAVLLLLLALFLHARRPL